MTALSISRAWEETKDRIAADGKLFTIVAAALIVLPQTILGLAAQEVVATGSSIILLLLGIAIVIGLVAQVALIRLAIEPPTSVGEAIARGIRRLPAMLLSFLIVLAGLFVALMLLALLLGAAGLIPAPGAGQSPPAAILVLLILFTALVYAVFQLALPIAAAEPGGPLHLLSRSWTLAKGHYWRLLAFVGLVAVGLIFVFFAGQVGVGSLVILLLGDPHPWSLSALLTQLAVSMIQAGFTIVVAIMLARIYLQLSGRESAGVTVPRTGT